MRKVWDVRCEFRIIPTETFSASLSDIFLLNIFSILLLEELVLVHMFQCAWTYTVQNKLCIEKFCIEWPGLCRQISVGSWQQHRNILLMTPPWARFPYSSGVSNLNYTGIIRSYKLRSKISTILKSNKFSNIFSAWFQAQKLRNYRKTTQSFVVLFYNITSSRTNSL